jgi:hypothetical protein
MLVGGLGWLGLCDRERLERLFGVEKLRWKKGLFCSYERFFPHGKPSMGNLRKLAENLVFL